MAKTIADFITFRPSASTAFKELVLKQVWTNNYWPTGKSMYDEIVKKATGRIYDTRVTVVFTPGVCAYRDDGRLYYDPEYTSRASYFEPTQPTVIAKDMTYIYLFHELIHFYHDVVKSFCADSNEEFRATGLYDFEDERFSENSIRRDAGLPRRPCYNWKRTPNNAAEYDAEKAKRAQRNLPDQSLLGPTSKECRF